MPATNGRTTGKTIRCCIILGLPFTVYVVVPHFTACPHRQNYHKGGHGEADYNGGEHQGLGERVGIVSSFRHNSGAVSGQAAHRKQEQIDGVREQSETYHHRKGTTSQGQVEATGGQYPGGHCVEQFH
ncbi:hypothetical protein HORIV_24620 [Vreelandella olivaria]|uniref:Secreted protein n=1 Tax=Vreelandella olivaria TaxID=390919 RepID=A0ABM7GHR9_9GAMM|nr:hypothetical protein HORIV_24620 [Halomonas olivaria]